MHGSPMTYHVRHASLTGREAGGILDGFAPLQYDHPLSFTCFDFCQLSELDSDTPGKW